MKKRLLVILITFNSKVIIEKCLDSIIRQAFNDYALLIIDNNSTDGTIKRIKSYFLNHYGLENKTEILENNQNIGFAKAVNIGLRKALNEKYKAVVLINPDTYFDQSLFKNGIKTLFSEKNIGACSPKILYPDGKIWWFGTKLLSGKKIVLSLNYDISENIYKGREKILKKVVFEQRLLTGCVLFIKIEAIKKVRLFNENYFMYVEDVDYSLRLLKAGYKLFLFNKGKVYHIQAGMKENIGSSLKRHALSISSTGKYVLINYPRYIFIMWLIKLPLILGFKFIRNITYFYGK